MNFDIKHFLMSKIDKIDIIGLEAGNDALKIFEFKKQNFIESFREKKDESK